MCRGHLRTTTTPCTRFPEYLYQLPKVGNSTLGTLDLVPPSAKNLAQGAVWPIFGTWKNMPIFSRNHLVEWGCCHPCSYTAIELRTKSSNILPVGLADGFPTALHLRGVVEDVLNSISLRTKIMDVTTSGESLTPF